MSGVLTMPILSIQPSQLFISKAKLDLVRSWFHPDTLTPLPIKKLNEQIIFTDGHTRAYAAWLSGMDSVSVQWDEDELDWKAYAICVGWCHEEGIRSVADLHERIIEPSDYQRLWLDRCQVMHQELTDLRASRAN